MRRFVIALLVAAGVLTLASCTVSVANAAPTVCQVGNGCTGTSTAPSYGSILVGGKNGEYEFVATSTFTGGGSGAVSSVFGRTGAITAQSGDYTTSLIPEGTNLYYTDARVQAFLDGLDKGYFFSTTSAAYWQGVNNFFSTTSAAYWLGTKSTSDVAEGSNLYFTAARALANFISNLAATTSISSIVSLPNLSLPYSQLTGTPDLTQYFKLSDWYGTTTDQLKEGNNNLYFTNARSDARFITDLAATSSVKSIITLPSLSLPYSQVTGTPSLFSYPFPSNATTTTLVFNNGLISTASSTFGASVQIGTNSVMGAGGDKLTMNGAGGFTLLNGNNGWGINAQSDYLRLVGGGEGHTELEFTSDTGLSRLATGVLEIGNGTYQNTSGGLIAASSTLGGLTVQNTATTTNLTIGSITGSTQCLHVNSSGVVAGTGSDCGTGNGTVTSVALTTPMGLSVSGSPITSSGTLALALTSGYNIPLTASTTNWNSAYDSWNTNGANWNGAYTDRITSATYPLSITSNVISTVATSSLNLTTSSFKSSNVSQWTNDAGYLTSLSGAASSTLLADANTFSGVDSFTNASSDFEGTWQTFSPSHFQTALTLPLSIANGGTGLSSLGAGVATWLGTPSSANLASALTDETGSGNAVFSASPTLTGTLTAANANFNGNIIGTAATFSGVFTNTNATALSLNEKQIFSTNGTNYTLGLFPTVSTQIPSGVTNSGYIMALNDYAIRNYLVTGDAGTLFQLTGMNIQFGHYNTDSVSPTTDNAYGINIIPYAKTGTIGTLYDLYLGNVVKGGTISNYYGIYQADTAATNYFKGTLQVAGNSILTNATTTTLGVTGQTYLGGNVGIATSTPAVLLDLFSTASTTLRLDNNSTTQGGQIIMKDATGGSYTCIYTQGGSVFSKVAGSATSC